MNYKKLFSSLLTIMLLFVLVLSSLLLNGCKSKYSYNKMMKDAKLVWEDDFSSLDTTKWRQGFVPEQGKTAQARKGGFWSYDAVTIKDGNLVITTDYRENGELGSGWYSGALDTEPQTDNNLFTKKYGYFEVRCKVPRLYGGWAAFWLMPVGNFKTDKEGTTLNTGTDGAEIDIFESPFYYNKSIRNTINHAVHYDGYGDNLKTIPKTGIRVKDLYDSYHTYGLEWTEEYYKFYVDGVMTFKINNTSHKNNKGEKIKQNAVSQIEEYLLLSVEIVSPNGEGQSVGWCGDPMLNDKTKTYDFTVDYVKVYDLKV